MIKDRIRFSEIKALKIEYNNDSIILHGTTYENFRDDLISLASAGLDISEESQMLNEEDDYVITAKE